MSSLNLSMTADRERFIQELRPQIEKIAISDPQKAETLSLKVVSISWSQREIEQLRRDGLFIDQVIPSRGLVGGMEKAADVAIAALKGAIKILHKGNYSEKVALKEDTAVEASLALPDGTTATGVHTGGRIVKKIRSKCCCFCPEYELFASGKGDFNSQRVAYQGSFLNNLFHDSTGKAKYFIDRFLRYTGGFYEGKRSGPGKLEKYDVEKGDFYLYFEGIWENDAPHKGKIHNENGLAIEVKDGFVIGLHNPGSRNAKVEVEPTLRPTLSDVVPRIPHFFPPEIPANRPAQESKDSREQKSPETDVSKAVQLSNSQFSKDTQVTSSSRVELSFPPFESSVDEQKCPSSATASERRLSLPLIQYPLVAEKLADPTKQLTPEESLTVLTHCIQHGKLEAQKAKDQEILIVIGNTGAGKSTTVNYLSGCTMALVPPETVGINQEETIGDLVVVTPKSQGGTIDEIMPIGHTKQSKTFMPQIETNLTQKITYCDCPGFLDNRGAEINIANAVNIKNAIFQAKTVKVLILINYHSLKADRARGLTEMLKIATNLFGNTENLIKNKDSILIGISNVPQDIELRRLQAFISAGKFPVMEALSDRTMMFDPLDRPMKGGLDRSTFIEQIQKLKPIQHPSKIFNTVLTDEDETTLIHVTEQIGQTIAKALSTEDFKKAASQFRRLSELTLIQHPTIEKLLGQSNIHIQRELQQLSNTFKTHCHFGRFSEAEKNLESLKTAAECFDEQIEKLIDISGLKSYLSSCREKVRKDQEREQEYNQQFEKLREESDYLKALLTKQKQETEKLMAEQKKNFDIMIEAMKKNMDEALAGYSTIKEKLLKEKDELLAKKTLDLQILAGQNKEEYHKRLQEETEKLKAEFAKKLEANESEKNRFVADQQSLKTQKENELKAEFARLTEELNKNEFQQIVALTSSIAFGKDEWAKYIGDVGVEPPLPKEIYQILGSPCPFWKEKKIHETHMLILIPEKINGTPLTINNLEAFLRTPKAGKAVGYRKISKEIKTRFGDEKAPKSHWILMPKELIGVNIVYNSEKYYYGHDAGMNLDDQAFYSNPLRIANYHEPSLLDATTAILMEYVKTGKRLFSDNPPRYFACQSPSSNGKKIGFVGCFAASGLYIIEDGSGQLGDCPIRTL